MHGPAPDDPHPMAGFPQVCFIRNTVRNPAIEIGEYTYYDDPEDSEGFERNVLYLFPDTGDRLVIGRYCAIARGVRFIMNGANHLLTGFSTYPFPVFGHGWDRAMPTAALWTDKGPTVVGNDVWLGYEALVMPGVRIGDGAIVASRAVVAADVPPYCVVAGNPARVVKQRFSPEVVAQLQAIAWWNWPADHVGAHLAAIMGGDLAVLRSAAAALAPAPSAPAP
jgi:virginiamycin A acetyltransferase